MRATTQAFFSLTAEDLMSRGVVTIPQESSLREAAQLLFKHHIGGAPVVDTAGRCVGVLSATDVVHWAADGCCRGENVPLPVCPFQVKGRLLTGEETVICTLAEGTCPLQQMRPTTSGRHTAVCLQPGGVLTDWQQVAENLPADSVRRYRTADFVTVETHTPLPELARTMIDAHIHRVFVTDELRRPVGVVSTLDLISAVARAGRAGSVSDRSEVPPALTSGR
jgi:CBS domain-containing protein